MFKLPYALPVILFCLCLLSCSEQSKKVLIFSKTSAFRHNSIEVGIKSICSILDAKNIQVVATEESSYFTEDSLNQFAAVIFLNTTGDVLNNIQQADFERYIQAGGGFVGVHSATDTEYHWPWYNRLVGAYFNGHPPIQRAEMRCVKKEDQCCAQISDVWWLDEEWYNFKSINPDIDVIMEVDEDSYIGGTHGKSHPVVWKHNFDGGRSFYTALGHKEETFSNSIFLDQLYAGIDYAIAKQPLNYANATSLRIHEENRFVKKVLDFNLDEPMELDELGERGIIYIERRGAIKLYEYETGEIKVLDSIRVHYDDEDGLLGLAVDPNYVDNKWIYLFYSPRGKAAVQNISRYTLFNDKLTEEKILLSIPLIRECCHSGGSLEFGNDNLLYIGVGDNTNPFESSGYAPIDERKNRKLYDAQRSASNTNDLRGKILRIKPENDGSYSIPEGNLFSKENENCRQEIYVMGCRNPFRFSIDSKTDFLYWGDVGPDAGEQDSVRGPAGLGEFNQAKNAGFFGWPYGIGNNQMYVDYDFKNESSLKRFNPNQIINDSPNNSGIAQLPEIQESFIWYGYTQSSEFPWLGAGGVNPMSGPIYYADDYLKSEHSFPADFEGKWFVYEWMRDWIYTVEFDKNNQFVQASPFMPNTDFSHPMDMIFSKDGNLYMLEYGQKWNSRNIDARMSVINYNHGNRSPIAKIESDKTVGALPLEVLFSATNSVDHDQDKIKYTWTIGEEKIKSEKPLLNYIFRTPGVFNVELTVTDAKGKSSTAQKKIMAGNEPPKIDISISDENTTYWRNKDLSYQIIVSDIEDGSSTNGTIDVSNVKVTFDYIPEGKDIILASIGHQQNVEPKGLMLINSSDCKACHGISNKVAGPSYTDISKRYNTKDKQTLVRRIIKGSQGVWGETMMAPHPQLSIEEVEQMVDYILSLDSAKDLEAYTLPLSGRLSFDQHTNDDIAGKYILMASYLDKGNSNIQGSSLSVVREVVFIPPKIEMENAIELDSELGIWDSQNRTLVGSIKGGKHIKFDPISFKNLESITLAAAFNKDYNYYGQIEIRKGKLTGDLLGNGEIGYFSKDKEGSKTVKIDLETSIGVDTLFLVFKNPYDKDQYAMNGDWIQLNYSEVKN